MFDLSETENQRTQSISWGAVILAIIAIIISVASYLQANSALKSSLDEPVKEMTITTNKETARLRAESRLQNVRTRLLENKSIESIDTEIVMLRQDFYEMYTDNSENTEQDIAQMNQELDALEKELGENTAAALARVESLIERLKKSVESTTKSTN